MKIQDMETQKDGWRPSREQVSEFLRSQTLCTFITVDESGAPQGATVAFSETADGEFIVGTSQTSRKATNVGVDEHVAMVVTDDEKRYTVQLEGVARKLGDDEFAELSEEHYNQLPASRPFKDEPGQVHILISSHHLRFSDCSVHPWVLTEFET